VGFKLRVERRLALARFSTDHYTSFSVSTQQGPKESPNVGELIARYFEEREWGQPKDREVSKYAGLDPEWVKLIIEHRNDPNVTVRRATLLKIAAAMDLTAEERSALESSAGLPNGSLKATQVMKVQHPEISMRRAVLLLTAPTDPHLLPFRVKRRDISTRSGVVFGMHDVVVRVTTPEDLSVLDYADNLFKSKMLRTIETIPLRDDLPIYVDREFNEKGLEVGDYYWAVIFVQALATAKKPEPRDIFHEVASLPKFKGGIHLLTAGVVVGQFDTVIEVLAANLSRLKEYVRAAQQRANEAEREVHTVTYFAQNWLQRPVDGAF
jgi:hypothetical protein